MQRDTSSPPLWHFPVTAMPDAPPEPLDPMELIARWQEEVAASATVDPDVTAPRKAIDRRRR